jgi:hypothetical protein
MNLQELLTPIAQATETSFDLFLVPISNMVNWAVIVLGFVGVAIWMKMQTGYNTKADQQQTIR